MAQFDIAGLRQEAGKLQADLEGLNIGANSSNEDLDKAEKLSADLDRVNRSIKLAEADKQRRATTAKSGSGDVSSLDDASAMENAAGAPPSGDLDRNPALNFSRAMRAVAVAQVDGGGDMTVGRDWSARTFGERHPVTAHIDAAMQANDAAGGAVFVPERLSASFIPLLTPRTVMRRISRGAPLIGGTDNIPTVEKGVAAHYIGEGNDICTTEPEFGMITVKEREIAALVPISQKLLRLSSIAIDMFVQGLLFDGFALTEDVAFYMGSGTGAAPKGLRQFIADKNRNKATAAWKDGDGNPKIAVIEADLRKMELALSVANVPMIDVRWLMHDIVFLFLRDLRDGNGVKIFPSLDAAQPTLRGRPVERYNSIPTDGGKTEIVLGDFAFSMVADSYQIKVDASKEASYMSGGKMVSAYSKNQYLIRGIAAHDYAATRRNAFALLTEVTWGF